MSSLLKALVDSSGEFESGEGREMELKGMAGTHQVFGVKCDEKTQRELQSPPHALRCAQHQDGDQEKASASLAISTELGTRPLMEGVQSRREILRA